MVVPGGLECRRAGPLGRQISFTTSNQPFENTRRVLAHGTEGMAEQLEKTGGVAEPVGSDELNAWKRGFTPQAEIWNGRLAMIGLSAGLAVVLLVRVFAGN